MTLRLNGSSSGFTEVKAPAAAGSNTITLPTSNGSAEQFLKNSGTAGTLEYSSMVETSTGVGIGTSSPATDLAVVDGSVGIELDNSGGFSALANTATVRAFDRPNTTYKALGLTGSDILFGINDVEKMRFDSTARLLIDTTSALINESRLGAVSTGNTVCFKNTSSSDQPLLLWNSATSGDNSFVTFFTETSYTSRGKIDYNRSAGQVRYNTTSDRRLKSEIEDSTSALNTLNDIRVRKYKWTETDYQIEYGFVAQELNAVVPDAVSVGDDEEDITDVWQVDNSTLVPLLTKALQEAVSKIETLETQNTAQQTQIDDLLARVTALEAA